MDETEDYTETDKVGLDLIRDWNRCLISMIDDAKRHNDIRWLTFLSKQLIQEPMPPDHQ